MQKEEIKGIIPEVRLPGAFGFNSNVLFVSTKRLVFIQLTRGYQILIGGLVGAIFDTYRSKAGDKPITDPTILKKINLDALIRSKKSNKVIYLHGIKEIGIRRWLGAIKFSIFGFKKNKKKLLMDGFLIPPKNYFKRYKNAGFKPKEINRRYALEARNILVTVLFNRIKFDL